MGGRGFLRCGDDDGDWFGEAAGFVGVEAVVANGLLAFGRDVLDGGGEKVGSFACKLPGCMQITW